MIIKESVIKWSHYWKGNLSGMRAGVTQAASRISVSVSFMSFLLVLMYSSSNWLLMDAMLGWLNLSNRGQGYQTGWISLGLPKTVFIFKNKSSSNCALSIPSTVPYLFIRPFTVRFSFSSSALRLLSMASRMWGGTYLPAVAGFYKKKTKSKHKY